MSVIAFPDPFVHREHRRCRVCSARIEVILLAGALVPRDPYFSCSECLDASASLDRIETLIVRETQLHLVEDDRG